MQIKSSESSAPEATASNFEITESERFKGLATKMQLVKVNPDLAWLKAQRQAYKDEEPVYVKQAEYRDTGAMQNRVEYSLWFKGLPGSNLKDKWVNARFWVWIVQAQNAQGSPLFVDATGSTWNYAAGRNNEANDPLDPNNPGDARKVLPAYDGEKDFLKFLKKLLGFKSKDTLLLRDTKDDQLRFDNGTLNFTPFCKAAKPVFLRLAIQTNERGYKYQHVSKETSADFWSFKKDEMAAFFAAYNAGGKLPTRGSDDKPIYYCHEVNFLMGLGRKLPEYLKDNGLGYPDEKKMQTEIVTFGGSSVDESEYDSFTGATSYGPSTPQPSTTDDLSDDDLPF